MKNAAKNAVRHPAKHGCDNCSHCGACCVGWDIELSAEDIRVLAELGYRLNDFMEIEPAPRMKNVGMNRRCVFLDRDNFCSIHSRHGHGAKPHTCRHYPKITPEMLAKKDYRFFMYAGKTFPRAVMMGILDSLKGVDESELFDVLLFRLEKLRKQRGKYIDTFNYDDKKRHSELSKAFARRRMKKLAVSKVRKDDAIEFDMIKKRKTFNSDMFLETLRNKIKDGAGHNRNLPEMLLAFVYAIRHGEPRDAKALAEYFFKWNEKRF